MLWHEAGGVPPSRREGGSGALAGLHPVRPTGAGATAAPLYPNLVADSPGAAAAPSVYDDGSGPRLLMRFSGYVHNAGPGALEIRGSGRSGATMSTVRQRVYDSAGDYVD